MVTHAIVLASLLLVLADTVNAHWLRKDGVQNLDEKNLTVTRHTPCFSERWRQRVRAELKDFKNSKNQKPMEEGNCLDNEDIARLRAHPEDAIQFLGHPMSVADRLKLGEPGKYKGHKGNGHKHKHDQGGSSEGDYERCQVKPSLLYIGVGHSGSTTLASQLNRHPHIKYGLMKEHSFLHYGAVSFAQYLKEFRVSCDTKVTFDAWPSAYTRGSENENHELGNWRGFRLGRPYVEEVKRLYGDDLKLIMMIRDPVNFLVSVSTNLDDGAQVPARKFNLDDYISGKVITSWGKKQLRNACYADSLQTWMEVFPRKNFLFLKSEDFFTDHQTVLNQVFDFIGVEPKTYTKMKSAGRRRTLPQQGVRPQSRLAFHHNQRNIDCKQRLEKLTGMTFDWEGSEPTKSEDSEPKEDEGEEEIEDEAEDAENTD